jgi:hypothetical protein
MKATLSLLAIVIGLVLLAQLNHQPMIFIRAKPSALSWDLRLAGAMIFQLEPSGGTLANIFPVILVSSSKI